MIKHRWRARPVSPAAGTFACPLDRRRLRGLLRHLRRLSVQRGGLVDQLGPLSCSLLRELVDRAHQRFLELSHLVSNPILRLGRSFRARPLVLDLSHRMVLTGQHAFVFLIPRYGRIDKPEVFPQKTRPCWGDSYLKLK